jgi:hypothetical protein
MERVGLAVLAITLAGAGSGCDNGKSISPTPTVSTTQVAGTWSGTASLTSVSDGDCVSALLQPSVGSTAGVNLVLQQTGSSVTGALSTQSNGFTCSYSGSVAGNTINLTLTSCQANSVLGLQCGAGGRDIVLTTSVITATLAGNTLTGTQADTWKVLVAGTTTSVGTLKSTESFSMQK